MLNSRHIIVTGTPGTGKTYLSKLISKKFNIKYIDVKNLILKEKLYESYDNKNKTYIVSEKKLGKLLFKILSYSDCSLVIDSHMAQYIKPDKNILCIVTRCNLSILNKRLIKRRYSKSKIRDNLDSEIFNVCGIEAQELEHNTVEIDTSKSYKKNVFSIISKFLK